MSQSAVMVFQIRPMMYINAGEARSKYDYKQKRGKKADRAPTRGAPARGTVMLESNPLMALYFNYLLDGFERSILFLDVLRQRGNDYLEQSSRTAPHVLNFGFNLLIDGRTLPKPVNYGLVEIVPPAEVTIDPQKRPFIVFDPRAGHGPGIGGMKHDSEIGVALRAGHPCYFVGFLPRAGTGPDD